MTTAKAIHPESSLAAEVLDAIRRLDACSLSNAIETFGIRPATEGFADSSIHCFVPSRRPMLGYAATARIRSSSVPITGQRYGDRAGWWEYLLAAPAPRVMVFDDVGLRPGLGAFVGEVHAAILMRLGCVGAVTNGAVRDLAALEAMDFAVFAGNVAVSHCYAHLAEFGPPVVIGGLHINPGDLIFGDRHGVLSIPKEIAAEIPQAAARLAERERQIIDACHAPDFSLKKLLAVVSGREDLG